MEPMEGRWVCRRCFASNEPDAAACVQCGLERGADPAAADPQDPQQAQQWAARTPPPARPMWMQLALRFWWIGLIVVVAVGGWYFSARRDDSGQIANSGNLEVGDLRVGDCFDHKDADAEVFGEVEAKPCTKAHGLEIFHSGSMPSGDYPSDDVVTTWVGENCLPAFESYVATSVETTTLDFTWYVPTEDGWGEGDSSVLCAVYDPNDAQLTTSLKGSAR
jgi:hypothetical protein